MFLSHFLSFFVLALCLSVSKGNGLEHQDSDTSKTQDHMPIGSCWHCQEESSVCVENCVYECLNPCCLRGVWLPEAPPVFLPFKADPRQLAASAGWRFNDEAIGEHVIDVSYFDTVPVYRWFNVGYPCGQLELALDGALWGVFQPTEPSSPLVNADYYIGGSLNYGAGPLSLRLRLFHISSHVGDEFLLAHPTFDRKNPSAEYIDLFASYLIKEDIRVYLGAGYIPHRDSSFSFKRFYAEGGSEIYLPWHRFFNVCHMLEGRPYFAFHLRVREDNEWEVDQTYALGYEIGKLYGIERKLRLYFEYHNGYSLEGQFCHENTDYFSLRMSYGF